MESVSVMNDHNNDWFLVAPDFTDYMRAQACPYPSRQHPSFPIPLCNTGLNVIAHHIQMAVKVLSGCESKRQGYRGKSGLVCGCVSAVEIHDQCHAKLAALGWSVLTPVDGVGAG